MNSRSSSRSIALGTAQFGLTYGIANTTGQVSRDESAAILSLAKQRGIDTLDTAIAYGESESVLGDIGILGWKIISKLPPLPDSECDIAGWVERQVNGSLQRLKVNRLHALLLHRPAQLMECHGNELYSALVTLRRQGVVEKIGISIYEPSELDQLTPYMHFDLVQAPFSLLDTRIVDSGWTDRLANIRSELHVRSVFLQGLLLMAPGSRPSQFARWQSLWVAWHGWLEQYELTPLQACLRYALNTSGISKVVLGTDSVDQLKQILLAMDGDLPPIPESLKVRDPLLLNPALWNSL